MHTSPDPLSGLIHNQLRATALVLPTSIGPSNLDQNTRFQRTPENPGSTGNC